MLQIISGKFFTKRAMYRHEGKGILFSNYKWYSPIETSVATLDMTDVIGSVSPCVVSYLNQIEKESKTGAGVLIRTGDWEILEQFRLVSMIGLRALFHSRRDVVTALCRSTPLSMSDSTPGSLVPRYFQPSIQGTQEEVAYFRKLVKHLIGLPRETYLGVLAAMKGMANALEVVGENIDLAYSLLVFCLESLCQSFDGYDPTWRDYPDGIAARLDPLLLDLDPQRAAAIREALLRDQHLKLRKRFVEFVLSNIRDSFYGEEAEGTKRPPRRLELAEALSNAYQLRSGYAHALEPIHELIRTRAFASGETLLWKHKPYLTLAGLARLARHVLCTFVLRQGVLETEAIDWRKQLPGSRPVKWCNAIAPSPC